WLSSVTGVRLRPRMTEDSNGLHQQRVGVGVPTGRRRLEVVFSVSFLSLCNWAADSKSTLHVKRVQNLVIQLRLRRSPRQFGPTEYPSRDATAAVGKDRGSGVRWSHGPASDFWCQPR